MKKNITIPGFIGTKAMYDESSQMIFGVDKNNQLQLLLDVRGWGAIQNLFKDEKEALKFQDELGEWFTDAINQKLQK